MADEVNSAAGKQNTPSMPNVETAALGQESKNVFTELFGNDASQKGSGLMTAVTAQQEKKTGFFGTKPKDDDALTLKKFKEHPSHPGSAALKASFLIFILVLFGFMSQNSSKFSFYGTNPALERDQAQDQVDALQTQVNVTDHITAVLLLDEFSSKADEYFYNVAASESDFSAENRKTNYADRVDILKPELSTLLEKIQGHFATVMDADAIVAAQTALDLQITELHAKQGSVDDATLLQDIQDLETTKTLLSQESFKSLVNAIDPIAASDEDFETVYDAFSTINASVSATISNIKAQREEWSVYLEEIEALTKDVDPLFNTEFNKSLVLDSVRFNADGTITVAGSTSTEDTKNFTLISDLIDVYEESEYFKDVEERSYTKSDDEDIYTGNFRISLTLEQ